MLCDPAIADPELCTTSADVNVPFYILHDIIQALQRKSFDIELIAPLMGDSNQLTAHLPHPNAKPHPSEHTSATHLAGHHQQLQHSYGHHRQLDNRVCGARLRLLQPRFCYGHCTLSVVLHHMDFEYERCQNQRFRISRPGFEIFVSFNFSSPAVRCNSETVRQLYIYAKGHTARWNLELLGFYKRHGICSSIHAWQFRS